MKIEINHFINYDYPNEVEKTVKTWSILGVVIIRKVYHYPKLQNYDVVNL